LFLKVQLRATLAAQRDLDVNSVNWPVTADDQTP